jgi:hypothetical protein
MIAISRQCELLGLYRSSYYYSSQRDDSYNLELMRLIDEQFTRTPFYGVPKMSAWLRSVGHPVNHKRVRRLMRKMGLEAIYPKPRLSQSHPEHKIYLYLLKGVTVDHVDQVWCADISVLQKCERRVSYDLTRSVRSCMGDGGIRPSEVCLQGSASNHPQRHWSKAFVVSVEGKGIGKVSGVDREGEHP